MTRRARSALLVSGLLLLVLVSIGSADAWNEPDGFLDIPWGAPVQEVLAKLPTLKCSAWSMFTECEGELTVGSVRVHVSIRLVHELSGGMGGAMTQVLLSFAKSDYPAMRKAFLEKYGDATGKTPFGGLEWRGEKANVWIDDWGSGIASIEMGNRQWQMMLERRQKQKAPPATKKAPLDINSASVDELKTIKGIGEADAKKIFHNRPYATKDELVKKKVVPKSTYDKIKDQIEAFIWF